MLNHTGPEPIQGVIFDFHSTLVDGGDPERWIADANRSLGREQSFTPGEFAALRDYLRNIWHHANKIDPRSDRDLSHELHREVFTRTVAGLPGIDPELIGALYAVMADQWTAFDDTLPVLQGLKSSGVRIVVLSNIGLDIRPCLKRAGVSDLVDGVVLSYEVGVVKPDPAIFELAVDLLEVPAARTLMVGDSPRDDVGGAPLGIRTLILPRTDGPVHGLGTVLRMV